MVTRRLARLLLLITACLGCEKIVGLRTAREGPVTLGDAASDPRPIETRVPDAIADHVSSDAPFEAAPDAIADTAPELPADVGNPDAPITSCAVEMERVAIAFKASALGPGGGMGACSYPPTRLPPNRYYAAMDGRLLRSEVACGACVRVYTSNGSVSVDAQIIDLINITVGRDQFALGLDPSAHAAFGSTGNPELKFRYVPCDVQGGNIQVTFDDTTVVNTAVLIMNHRTRLRGIQIRRPGGFVSLTLRQDFRWMVPGSIDESSNEMIFTDSSGRTLLAPKVPFRGEFQDSDAQFPPCP